MFYNQAEFEFQVDQYLAMGMSIAEACLMTRQQEQRDAFEYRRWCEEADLEIVE